MKLKLVAAISALAIPALAHAQQGGPQPKVPKPTKADAQNVVQIVTSDKVKTQAYCDFTKLEDQVKTAAQKNDTKTLEALSRQAELSYVLCIEQRQVTDATLMGQARVGCLRPRLHVYANGATVQTLDGTQAALWTSAALACLDNVTRRRLFTERLREIVWY
jgi:hypothetical protein